MPNNTYFYLPGSRLAVGKTSNLASSNATLADGQYRVYLMGYIP